MLAYFVSSNILLSSFATFILASSNFLFKSSTYSAIAFFSLAISICFIKPFSPNIAFMVTAANIKSTTIVTTNAINVIPC